MQAGRGQRCLPRMPLPRCTGFRRATASRLPDRAVRGAGGYRHPSCRRSPAFPREGRPNTTSHRERSRSSCPRLPRFRPGNGRSSRSARRGRPVGRPASAIAPPHAPSHPGRSAPSALRHRHRIRSAKLPLHGPAAGPSPASGEHRPLRPPRPASGRSGRGRAASRIDAPTAGTRCSRARAHPRPPPCDRRRRGRPGGTAPTGQAGRGWAESVAAPSRPPAASGAARHRPGRG